MLLGGSAAVAVDRVRHLLSRLPYDGYSFRHQATIASKRQLEPLP